MDPRVIAEVVSGCAMLGAAVWGVVVGSAGLAGAMVWWDAVRQRYVEDDVALFGPSRILSKLAGLGAGSGG